MNLLRFTYIAAILALFSVSAPPALAQDVSLLLPEIIVTANRRSQAIQDVNMSITAVTAERLEQFNILNANELADRVPNFTVQDTGRGSPLYRIRGIGTGALVSGFEQSVGQFTDDIYMGRSAQHAMPFFDTERIEVIRGPSSSLYGSSSGGVISIFTEDGPDTPFIEVGITIGEFDHQKYQFKTGGRHKRLNYFVNACFTKSQGYSNNKNQCCKRPHSQGDIESHITFYTLNNKLGFRIR